MSSASLARRLRLLPPYLFVELDRLKEQVARRGRDVIDLGVGDPDQPTPNFILQAMTKAIRDAANHTYPTNRGLLALRKAIASWYQTRFGVHLNPETEILPLIGSKEGIAHLPLAYVNPGEPVLIPDPGYPPYRTGTILAGGVPVAVPLRKENGFLPDLERLGRLRPNKAKLFFLNYPNNPTGAVANLAFFKELVRFAHRFGILICHDAAYSEIVLGRQRPPSFLQAAGAKEVGIEFHSLSKTFNMTGWRVGWACGNAQMITALAKVKSNIDSGLFGATQVAAIAALRVNPSRLKKMLALYKRRAHLFVRALQEGGWPITIPEATFYLWSEIPRKVTSQQVARRLLEEAGVVAAPGVGFGRYGEGYVRFSLTVATPRLKEAARRIKKLPLWLTSSSA